VYKPHVHPLHKLMTARLPSSVSISTNTPRVLVRDTNRKAVVLGTPTLGGDGERRSAFSHVIRPLWRQHFSTLDVMTEVHARRVVLEPPLQSGAPARVVGVECSTKTESSVIVSSPRVVVAAGCLETPALLMRSGIGPTQALHARNIPVRVANEHVGRGLRDKMLVDDMMITDFPSGEDSSFGRSLFILQSFFGDGVSVQLHKYDKSTVGNNFLAVSRLLRGRMGPASLGPLGRYLFRGSVVMCFQTSFKMNAEAVVSLNSEGRLLVLRLSACLLLCIGALAHTCLRHAQARLRSTRRRSLVRLCSKKPCYGLACGRYTMQYMQ
jgi:choline dehydrogenase-like flavoprotein